MLEVATGSPSNGCADGRAVVVNVVRRGLEIDTTLGLTSLNGDYLPIGQGHSHRRLGRIAQGHGIGDHATFGDAWRSSQSGGRGIDRVTDYRLSRCRVRRQLLEVATGSTGNSCADGRAVVVDVVRRRLEVDAALSLASLDGDYLPIGQGHRHRRLGRVAQGHGVGNHATFCHRRIRRQRRSGGVDGISNLSDCRRLRHCYRQAAAAGGTRYSCRDLATVDIRRVICRHYDIDAAGGLPGRDDDNGTVGQGDDQVGGRRLANRGGIDDYATRFADGRGGAKNQVGSNVGVGRRRSHLGIAGGIQQANLFAVEPGSKAQPLRREANGSVDPARGFFEHHEAVSTAQRTAAARCGRAGCGGVKLGSRVDTGSDRLLQLFHRRRSLCGRLAQVGAAVRRISAPLAVAAQVKQTAIGQLQSNCAARASEHFLTCQQAVPFDEHTTNALWGYRNNLADNAFDDGYNAAHWTLRVTLWVLPCQSGTRKPLQAELCR